MDLTRVLGTGLFDMDEAAEHPEWLKEARIGEHDGVEALVRSLRLHGGAPAIVTHITHTLYAARSLLASGLHSAERAGKFLRTGGCSAPSSRRCNAAPS